MTEEQGKLIIELLTEIRDEIYRQGFAHRQDHHGQTYIAVEKI